MTISSADIETALRAEDTEGFLKLGAPGDEYALEAKEIASILASLSKRQRTLTNIVEIVSSVWTKYFNLSAQDIEKRIPAFQRIAEQILT